MRSYAVSVLLLLSVMLATAASSVEKRAAREIWWYTDFTSVSAIYNDFHASTTGDYGWDAMAIVNDPAGGNGRVLRVHYDQGSYSSLRDRDRGAQFYGDPTGDYKAMMLSYDVYFANNFDFVKGGKLPGLWGGEKNCTGGRRNDGCFTTRFMWRAGGAGEIYAYISNADAQLDSYCQNNDVICKFTGSADSLCRGNWYFTTGRWQHISQYVHLNTPGWADGYIRVFFDGRLVCEMRNLSIRVRDGFNIDGILFSTFFGGSDTTWASTHSTYSYFKNFVLSLDPDTPVIVG